ncbi:MAG: hypothetical protein ACK4MG_01030, partial [Aquabacterium sp.]
TAPASRMGVLRAAASIGSAQRVGFIATQGTPDGTGDNQLAGLDYQYRSTSFLGARTLEAYAWAQHARDGLQGTGGARGASLRYPNIGLTGQLDWYDIDAAFRPALGYVRETGVRIVDATIGWRQLDEHGANTLSSIHLGTRRRHDGTEQSQYTGVSVEWFNPRGDYVMPEAYAEREVLAAPFEPLPGARVAAGDHRYGYALISAGTTPARAWSGEASVRAGGFYDGALAEQTLKLAWRPSAHWSVVTALAQQQLRTAAGSFTARTGSVRLEHAASTRSAQSLTVQHDNVSQKTLAGFRSRWRMTRDQELRVALDHTTSGRQERTGGRPASDFRATVSMSWAIGR